METTDKPIVLVLSRKEALVLANLTGHVGGCHTSTYRRMTLSIQEQLNKLGIEWDALSAFEKNAGLYAKAIGDTDAD